MSQAIKCQACQRRYAFKEELAGKRVRCKCGARLEFPKEPDLSEGGPETPRGLPRGSTGRNKFEALELPRDP